MTTTTEKASEAMENAGRSVHHQTEKLSDSMDTVKKQLVTYGDEIQEYLGRVDAKVDSWKFSLERQDDGLTVDIAFRATVHPKK
jgi:hypothetical protein